MSLIKVIGWTGGLALFAFGTKKALELKGKASAAKDLKMDLGSFNIRKASVKEGVLFDVILKATNNSASELKFTQPFVEVSIQNDKKEFSPIATSTDAEGVVTLPPRKTSDLKFNLNISPTQALKIPGLVMHIVKKMSGFSPDPKLILVEFGLESEGVFLKQKSNVTL